MQRHVALEPRQLLGREVQVVDAQLARLAQDVVVDVGDVANAVRLVTGVAQSALQDVEGQVDEGVAQVRRVVRRDAAAVHRHERSGVEREDAAARRVVEVHQLESRPRASRSSARGERMLIDTHTAVNASTALASDIEPAMTA